MFVRLWPSIVTCIFVGLFAFGPFSLTADAQQPNARQPNSERMQAQQKRIQLQMIVQQLTMLDRNAYLRDHLEIADEQLVELKPVLAEFKKKQLELGKLAMERHQETQKAIADKDYERLRELGAENMKASSSMVDGAMEKLSKILLPHQIERVEQIGAQAAGMMNPEFQAGLGIPLALARRLDLTDEQIKDLRSATEEANEEFRKEVDELKKKLMEDVLKSLPEEKRKAYEELVGDYYDYEESMRSVRKGYQRQHQKMQKKEPAADN